MRQFSIHGAYIKGENVMMGASVLQKASCASGRVPIIAVEGIQESFPREPQTAEPWLGDGASKGASGPVCGRLPVDSASVIIIIGTRGCNGYFTID